MEKLSSCTVLQLREFLKKLNLPTAGSKAELLMRLSATNVDSWLVHSELGATALELPQDGAYSSTRDSGVDTRSERSEPRQEESSRHVETRECMPEDVRRELDLLRRERDVLQRELALTRGGQDDPTAPRRSSPRVREIGEMLPDFSGEADTFENWKAQLQFLRATFELDENTSKILVSMKLKGTALAWFHSTPSYLQMTTSELVTKMDRMFNQRPSRLILRRRFEERVWRPNETFAQYLHEKVILANRVPVPEAELVEYAIDGVPDSRLRSQARMHRFKTQEDLLEGFEMLSLDQDAREPTRRRDGEVDFSRRSKGEATAPRRGPPRCYNCGEMGHMAGACQRQQARDKGTCSRCGARGHRAATCPEEPARDRPTPAATTNVLLSIAGGEPYTTSLSYIVKDSSGNPCTFSMVAMIDSGSPISLIKDDFVPVHARQPVPSDMTPYHGLNGSKLNVVSLFECSCSVNEIPLNLKFHVVPTETMAFAALLGRDFLSCPGISVCLGEDATILRGKGGQNEQVGDVNEILNISCGIVGEKATQDLRIDSQISQNYSECIHELDMSRKQLQTVQINSERLEQVLVEKDIQINLLTAELHNLSIQITEQRCDADNNVKELLLQKDNQLEELKMSLDSMKGALDKLVQERDKQNVLLDTYKLAEGNSFERALCLKQDKDSDIRRIRSELEIRENKHIELRDGLVYRKWKDKLLFYVPECLESNVIRMCHNDLGHVGSRKASRGYKHMLSIVGGFTKFTRLYPRKSTTAEETLKHLTDYFRVYSRPKRLVSDRETLLVGDRDLCAITHYVVKKALDFNRYVVTDVDGFQLTQIPYTGTISVEHMRLWDGGP